MWLLYVVGKDKDVHFSMGGKTYIQKSFKDLQQLLEMNLKSLMLSEEIGMKLNYGLRKLLRYN